MKFTTTTGKEVELKRPALLEAAKCEDASPIAKDPRTGGLYVHNAAQAGVAWCSAGLGIAPDKLETEGYSLDDVLEIGAKVKEIAHLDPTKPSDSDSTAGSAS